jgi:hypothetical protein
VRPLSFGWKCKALVAALVFPPLLQVVSLSTLTRWILRRQVRPSPDPNADEASLGAWIDRVMTRLPGPWRRTCLKRAFVLFYLLRRAGRPAELRIGVRRDPEAALSAHAWLVRNGLPVLEQGADHLADYRVLTNFP